MKTKKGKKIVEVHSHIRIVKGKKIKVREYRRSVPEETGI